MSKVKQKRQFRSPFSSPAFRVSFILVLFTASVLFIGHLIGLFPDRTSYLIENRKKVCESLALQLSLLASHSQFRLAEQTIKTFIDRHPDSVGGLMHTQSGIFLASHGDISELKDAVKDDDISTLTHVKVPIYKGNRRWGTVHIQFLPPGHNIDWFTQLKDSIYGLVIFVAFSSFFGYMFIIRRSVRELDPKSVIPERVKSAFNTLTEGVVILDEKQYILMANNAFGKKVGREADSLTGLKASSFNWEHRKEDTQEYPWVATLSEGKPTTGYAMFLRSTQGQRYSLSANCSPIKDDSETIRGALVTFEDISELEKQNIQLNKLIERLHVTEKEIKDKNRSLLKLANFDPLTNCYNRRALFEKFDAYFQEHIDEKKPLSCLMVDIDHFKAVNDNHGHAAGDKAIKFVSGILRKSTRESDIVGRYGGEEFCIVLKDTSIEDAYQVAEKIRKIIESTSADTLDEVGRITASLGASCLNESSPTPASLVDLADRALYNAKETGRNRVICWSETLEKPEARQKKEQEKPKEQKNLKNIEKNPAAKLNNSLEDIQTNVVKMLIEQVNELGSMAMDKEEELRRYRSIDKASGLATRAVLVEALEKAINQYAKNQKPGVVIIINANIYNRVSDTSDNTAGDALLTKLGRRLNTILKSSLVSRHFSKSHPFITCRLHSDEFGVLITNLNSTDILPNLAELLFKEFSRPINLPSGQIFPPASIGIAVYPNDGLIADELLRKATAAQRHIKKTAALQKIQFYDKSISDTVYKMIRLENDLQLALKRSQFELHYQPCIDVKTGHITSMEGLIRWQHQEYGNISPVVLIDIAERTGLIHEIGAWTFTAACRQVNQWADEGIHNIRIFINLSGLEVQNEAIVEKLKNILIDTNTNPQNIGVEVTETALVEDIEQAAKVISGLSQLGLKIALDDFGTGHSSLSYLKHLSFDILKIDRSFLKSIIENKRAEKLYAAIISMAHELNITTVSEGIETKEEMDLIQKLGADRIQGYYFCKPMHAGLLKPIILENIQQMSSNSSCLESSMAE